MTILRMDNVGIVFDDLDAAVAFFVELGLGGWCLSPRGGVGLLVVSAGESL